MATGNRIRGGVTVQGRGRGRGRGRGKTLVYAAPDGGLEPAVLPVKAAGGGVNYSLACAVGNYSLTGQAAALLPVHNYSLAAAYGNYTYSGNGASMLRALSMAAASGDYAGIGQSATFNRAVKLIAANGAYALTGQVATLTYTPGASVINYSLTCAAGGYAHTGQVAGLLRAVNLTAANGGYALTGGAATLALSRLMAGQVGGYTVSASAASLLRAVKLNAGNGSYVLTGGTAALSVGRQIAASGGAYSLSGCSAAFARAVQLPSGNGAYALTGNSANLVYFSPSTGIDYTMDCMAGGYALLGSNARAQFGVDMIIGPDAATIAAAVGSRAIEGAMTQDAMTRVILAALAGRSEGIGTLTEKYKSLDGTKDRITVSFDASSNRTTIVLDGA